MKTILLTIPDNVEINELDAKMTLASKLYENGKLTLGQAAELVGMSKSTFMELLSIYGVSLINHPVEDLKRDVENAKNYSI